MPWGDAQFWIVTLAALGGVWLVWRAVRPADARRRGAKTSLTISAGRGR